MRKLLILLLICIGCSKSEPSKPMEEKKINLDIVGDWYQDSTKFDGAKSATTTNYLNFGIVITESTFKEYESGKKFTEYNYTATNDSLKMGGRKIYYKVTGNKLFLREILFTSKVPFNSWYHKK